MSYYMASSSNTRSFKSSRFILRFLLTKTHTHAYEPDRLLRQGKVQKFYNEKRKEETCKNLVGTDHPITHDSILLPTFTCQAKMKRIVCACTLSPAASAMPTFCGNEILCHCIYPREKQGHSNNCNVSAYEWAWVILHIGSHTKFYYSYQKQVVGGRGMHACKTFLFLPHYYIISNDYKVNLHFTLYWNCFEIAVLVAWRSSSSML